MSDLTKYQPTKPKLVSDIVYRKVEPDVVDAEIMPVRSELQLPEVPRVSEIRENYQHHYHVTNSKTTNHYHQKPDRQVLIQDHSDLYHLLFAVSALVIFTVASVGALTIAANIYCAWMPGGACERR